MGSIQEALRELRSQRKLNENKKNKKVKPLKESKYSVTLDDGKVVEVNAKSEEDAKKQVENNDELIHVFKDGDNIGYRAHVTGVSKNDKANESLKEEAFVDEDGDIEKPDFNLQQFYKESCNGKNCSINECDKPLQEDADLLVDQDGDIEKSDFNLQKFYKESCNKNGINEAKEEDEPEEAEQPADAEGEDIPAEEPQEDNTNEFTVGAILSKFKDKDENAIVKVAPVEFEGQTFNINLDVNEDEEGNLTITGTLTPAESEAVVDNDVEIEEDFENVDIDGDVEKPDFNLQKFCKESLNEKIDKDKKATAENIVKLDEFKNLKKKVINAILRYAKKNNDVDTVDEFKDFMDDNYGTTGVAIQMRGELLPTDFYELVKDDRHFADVITKICKKIEWIDDNGIYIDGGSADGDKPSVQELILEYLRLASKDEVGQKITYDVLEKAYFDNDYSNLTPAKFKR